MNTPSQTHTGVDFRTFVARFVFDWRRAFAVAPKSTSQPQNVAMIQNAITNFRLIRDNYYSLAQWCE